MSVYTGLKCLACGVKFSEADDIVVCPECGTPYHRECYKKNGKCINSEYHEHHESYSAAAEHAKNIGAQITCAKCGAVNPPLALFCEKCGNPIVIEHVNDNPSEKDAQKNDSFGNPFSINYSDRLCGINPDESFDDVKASKRADFVGSNTFFFMPAFKIMKDRSRKVTFNLSASLPFPSAYFAYRKMTGMSVLTFIIQLLLMIPFLICQISALSTDVGVENNALMAFVSSINLNSDSFVVLINAFYSMLFVFWFLCGTFANWIYYKFAVKKISKLKFEGKASEIKKAGGTSIIGLSVSIISYFIVFFGILCIALF